MRAVQVVSLVAAWIALVSAVAAAVSAELRRRRLKRLAVELQEGLRRERESWVALVDAHRAETRVWEGLVGEFAAAREAALSVDPVVRYESLVRLEEAEAALIAASRVRGERGRG